jgi:hypothetical protein
MDDLVSDTADPRAAIQRLETRIETLEATIEGCRKFILASQVAIGLGALLLGSTLIGAIAFDALTFGASVAALLGGAVLLGSNGSTAREAAAELAAAEAARAALIGRMELRVVGGTETLH